MIGRIPREDLELSPEQDPERADRIEGSNLLRADDGSPCLPMLAGCGISLAFLVGIVVGIVVGRSS